MLPAIKVQYMELTILWVLTFLGSDLGVATCIAKNRAFGRQTAGSSTQGYRCNTGPCQNFHKTWPPSSLIVDSNAIGALSSELSWIAPLIL
jgi:hypothetical protein